MTRDIFAHMLSSPVSPSSGILRSQSGPKSPSQWPPLPTKTPATRHTATLSGPHVCWKTAWVCKPSRQNTSAQPKSQSNSLAVCGLKPKLQTGPGPKRGSLAVLSPLSTIRWRLASVSTMTPLAWARCSWPPRLGCDSIGQYLV